jgi:hypothetical protein
MTGITMDITMETITVATRLGTTDIIPRRMATDLRMAEIIRPVVTSHPMGTVPRAADVMTLALNAACRHRPPVEAGLPS